MTDAVETIHASCVCDAGRGLLILGRSGSGKSALALDMIALGARLVADDRVALRRDGYSLFARAPTRLAGLIEARGVGLLRLAHEAEVEVRLVLDLDAPAEGRLPPGRRRLLLGARVPLMVAPERLSPAVALLALRSWPPLDPDAPMTGDGAT